MIATNYSISFFSFWLECFLLTIVTEALGASSYGLILNVWEFVTLSQAKKNAKLSQMSFWWVTKTVFKYILLGSDLQRAGKCNSKRQ